MLHQTDIPVKPYELAEAQFNTGRFHIMDIVFRRWAALLQETLYAKMGMMLEVSNENVVQLRFEKFLDSVKKQPIYIFETLINFYSKICAKFSRSKSFKKVLESFIFFPVSLM